MVNSLRVFNFKIIKIFKGLISIISRFCSFLWFILSNREYWSGLFPTLILLLAAWYGLYQTKSQLKLLQEQITYVRQPVLLIVPRIETPIDPLHLPLCKLYIANVGNDTVKNVSVRLGLFLVTETEVYSYGDLLWPEIWRGFSDKLRARETLFPMFTLSPNDNYDLKDIIGALHIYPLIELIALAKEKKREMTDNEVTKEMLIIQDSLNGDYVLFADCSWRRKTDFAKHADTSYFRYYPRVGDYENVRLEIGGYEIIERIKSYMQHGPKLSIVVNPDFYEIHEDRMGFQSPIIKKKIPRIKE